MAYLEELLAENTKAVNGLAALLSKNSGPPAAAAAPTQPARGPGRPKKVTLAEVKAIAEKVRDEKGRPAAVSLIQKHGAETLAELEESKYAQFIAAGQVILNEREEPDPEPETESDDSL